jgi:aminocarboxymuconate-semialdehyde decarboxylase
MDAQKIDCQVVGGWLDMFGYEIPAEEGLRWSRLINKHLAEAAKREPRFVPLATVPLQDGARAAEVLDEAYVAGFKGAMIGTQPKGRGGVLDDPTLAPFWEAANARGSVIFIHPVFESGDDRVHDYGMANAVGRITDTLIAVSRLIYAGHIARYANAKVRSPDLTGISRTLRRDQFVDQAQIGAGKKGFGGVDLVTEMPDRHVRR